MFLKYVSVFWVNFFYIPGYRTNAVNTDLSDILPEDIEQEVKQAAEISMGTEISEEDIINITYLCDQVCKSVESVFVVCTETWWSL